MGCVCKLLILRKDGKILQKRVVKIHLRVKKENGFKGKGKKNASIKKEGEKLTQKKCSKEGHDEAHCWKLHPKMKPKKFNKKGKKSQLPSLKRIWDPNRVMKQKSQTWGFKERNPLLALVLHIYIMKLQMKGRGYNVFT